MSTQTGIVASDDLRQFFGKCRDGSSRGKYRMLKIVIDDEKLSLDSANETTGDWANDWDNFVLNAVEPDEPCYLLYRLDEKDGETYKWLMISWSPDSSSVRSKMLYASTKATLKKEFGGGQIKDDLYGNVKADISFKGYQNHCASVEAPGPLSREELEREEVKSQSHVEISVDSKHQTVSGLAFPLTKSAEEAVIKFSNADTNYVRLCIDVDKEIVDTDKSDMCDIAELSRHVPNDKPRYHLFRFDHDHEGDFLKSTLFIYTMPGYNCSIKERMLYSSCKNAVVEHLETFGVEISKKLEVEDGNELTRDFVYDELHPKTNLNKAKFARPAPPNRGNRRITKQV